jgi:preprotein translocase subunit SecA
MALKLKFSFLKLSYMGILDTIFGDPNAKVLKEIEPIVKKINALEDKYRTKSDEELKKTTEVLRNEIKEKLASKSEKDILDELLPDAFAAVREASRRTLEQRHFDVQLMGGIVLHQGKISEMKTGEGKTLVATLPLFLNALPGKGAHLVTVNDYLARIGAGWMARVYHALGMSTGVIIHESGFVYDPEYKDESQYDDRLKHFRPAARKEAYQADIVYGTNNEYGFDYLRDNMAPDLESMVQRDQYYAIVDEIDSILIDEARTPLIISAPAEESTDKYVKFAELVTRLKENEDYNVDEKMRAATLTESGLERMEKFLGVDNIYTAGGIQEAHHIEQALKAFALFKREKDYVVKEGEVIIVDEFTGRLMHGRRYSEGLHQAIEAKEGVKIQRESQTLATITFQNFFRMYKKLSGMTGTAVTEAEEFSKIYNLETVVIPTNKPNIRSDKNDLIYRTEEAKFKAVIEEAKKRSEAGQPVLVGTISIEKNEILAGMMERYGLKPNVLNAKNHEKEARFIAEAGKAGSITIATNMAGRGVDINLGGQEPAKGTPEYENWEGEHRKIIDEGGLHVIGTERHESRRIDNQLRGRSGRQGDPGSSQFFVSMDDDLMRIFGGDRMKSIMTTLNVPEDMPIENRLISKSIESAQKKVEGNNFDIRKHLVEYDDVLNKHRDSIYRKRREILEKADKAEKESPALSEIILDYIENEIELVVNFHTSAERVSEWNLEEIMQVMKTIYPVREGLNADISKFKDDHKLDRIKARTEIIELISKDVKEKYEEMRKMALEIGFNWVQVEKSALIRSIDSLWIEHLEAISSMRQGIGLRGYGQRDPLVEYKREAYSMYNELNSLIQKEVVYSIFKFGDLKGANERTISTPSLLDMARHFMAPSKTADASNASFSGFKKTAEASTSSSTFAAPKQKVKNEEGEKVGRNDLCPCGSGKKYKKCCGK